ncbi:SCO family protein [Aquimarina megaterium]|uniref:SCO family protein n=1 Tax=Aquimarina megaterium TaxID=1443666 RepID=UPI0009455274|nr:SCO family protein [Aquimarina megaterium]
MRLFLSLFISTILVCSCKKQEDKATVKHTVDKLPYFIASDFTPQWLTASDLEGKHKISSFSFINQNGDTITNDTYKGKIYVADFFFTICPGICPKLTKNMNLIQETYKDDNAIKLLSHTVMPWHDSVPVLKEYAIKHNIDHRKWNLVTGDKDEIYTIAREGYFADEDFIKTQDENNFIHTENFILVDTQGYIRGVYNGTIPLDVKRLMRHIEILKKEKL